MTDTYMRVHYGRVEVVRKTPSRFAHLDEQLRELVGDGLRDSEIGDRLGLQPGQVRKQRERLQLPAAHGRGRPRRAS